MALLLLPTITIRRASPADRAAMESAVPLPYDGTMLVADLGSTRNVAAIIFDRVVDDAGVPRTEVTALAVDPRAEGTGVSGRLLAAVERIADRDGTEGAVVQPAPAYVPPVRCGHEGRRRRGHVRTRRRAR